MWPHAKQTLSIILLKIWEPSKIKKNFKAVCNHSICTTEVFSSVSPCFPVLFKTGKLWLSAVRDGLGVEKAKYCWSTITYNSFASVTYTSRITLWIFFSTSPPPFQTITEWLRLEGNLWRSLCQTLQHRQGHLKQAAQGPYPGGFWLSPQALWATCSSAPVKS